MALRIPLFLQNGSHSAEDVRMGAQGLWRSTGVISASDLLVTQSGTPAMTVSVTAGWAAILGTFQALMGCYIATNDAALTGTIQTADPTNPRIDLVCLTVADAYYTGALNQITLNVVKGTAAPSPSVPATPANSIILAQVAVAAAATSIVNANITDRRILAVSAANSLGVNAQSGTTYTPTAVDCGNVVGLNNASAITVTIPANATVPLPLNVFFTFRQDNAGQVSFAAAGGVTITSNGGTSAAPKLRGQESWCQGYQSAANVWHFFGDIV